MSHRDMVDVALVRIEQYQSMLMNDSDPSVLNNQETLAAIAVLIQQLQDQDIVVSNRTARALYQLGEPVVAPLMDAFPTFTGPTRSHTVFILYKIGVPRALAALMTLLNEPDPTLRKRVAYYLVKSQNAIAIKAAIPTLLADLNEDTIKALGEAGDRRAVEPLLADLRATKPGFPSFYRRVALASALGQLGDPRAIPMLEQLVNSDTVEYDAWGVGVGLSVAEVAREALQQIAARTKQHQ